MSKQSEEKIAAAAKDAVKVISEAAEQAAKVLSNTTAESLRLVNSQSSSDHDLLIELKTLMGGVKDDIKDLRLNTTKRIDDLETGKLDIKDSYPVLYKAGVEKVLSDHIEAIKNLDSWKNYVIGVMAVTSGLAIFLAYELYNHLLQK